VNCIETDAKKCPWNQPPKLATLYKNGIKWYLVRRNADKTKGHIAKDNALGTQKYGTYVAKAQGNSSFSV
jgi:hypothetical protein